MSICFILPLETLLFKCAELSLLCCVDLSSLSFSVYNFIFHCCCFVIFLYTDFLKQVEGKPSLYN